jgi:cell wall-associated NlpC family hydrolase
LRRLTLKKAGLVATGALAATAVAAGCIAAAAPQESPTGATATGTSRTAGRVAVVADVRERLTTLEAQADRAGQAAEIADEAVLQHDTAAHRADAARAEAALAALADRQTPELTGLVERLGTLGVTTRATQDSGATITTAALVGRTRALRAVSFARKQIGDPYGYAKAGPRSWDCSGLTMKAYSAVKVSVGGHSATAQYLKAKRQHRLVSYSHRRAGDLIFYGRPGAVYHVAMYVGHGRMIEAPYPGKRVREVPVRGAGRLSSVGRPA